MLNVLPCWIPKTNATSSYGTAFTMAFEEIYLGTLEDDPKATGGLGFRGPHVQHDPPPTSIRMVAKMRYKWSCTGFLASVSLFGMLVRPRVSRYNSLALINKRYATPFVNQMAVIFLQLSLKLRPCLQAWI